MVAVFSVKFTSRIELQASNTFSERIYFNESLQLIFLTRYFYFGELHQRRQLRCDVTYNKRGSPARHYVYVVLLQPRPESSSLYSLYSPLLSSKLNVYFLQEDFSIARSLYKTLDLINLTTDISDIFYQGKIFVMVYDFVIFP